MIKSHYIFIIKTIGKNINATGKTHRYPKLYSLKTYRTAGRNRVAEDFNISLSETDISRFEVQLPYFNNSTSHTTLNSSRIKDM